MVAISNHLGRLQNPSGIPSRDPWSAMGVTPRDWQREALPVAIDAIYAQWEGHGSLPLVQAVMGAGKSLLLAAMIKVCLQSTNTIVVTTPRTMLVRQLSRTLTELLPMGLVGAYYGNSKQPGRRVIVACDASTERLARSLQSAGRQVDLWIADECHGSEADRIKLWVDITQPRARLGLTATPRRAKATEGLSLWTEVIYQYSAGDALRDGVVVPFRIRPWEGDGDVTLDDAMASMIADVVNEGVGPGVVDANSIDEAREFAEVLREEYGLDASSIDSRLSQSETRKRLVALENGELDVLVHVSILKEGVDLPWLRWIGLRRQVKSPVYFAQHVGRVLRAAPGKDFALILDPGDLFRMHSLTLSAILEVDVSQDNEDEDIPFAELGDASQLNSPDASPYAIEQERRVQWVVLLDRAQVWLRTTLTILRAHGYVTPPLPGFLWRNQEVSDSQLRAIELWGNATQLQVAIRSLGHDDADNLRALYSTRRRLSRGDASDLIDALACLAQHPEAAHIFADIPAR